MRRWLPERALIVVADSSYAALELLAWCRQLPQPVTIITRLRLDAALYEPPPARRPGQQGRPRVRGRRLPTLAHRLAAADTAWRRLKVNWYGAKARWLWVCSDTALWYHGGALPVAIRWVLLRDPKGQAQPQALLSTDLGLSPRQSVEFFVRRWAMETTFQEAHTYLGLDGQRQWNDLAVERSTPLRLALFSLVALIVERQPGWQACLRQSAWYRKARPTFADALAQVRRVLWRQVGLCWSITTKDQTKPTMTLFEHFSELLAYAA